jgi:glycerophosphoryl diester phosphodiesterase
MAAIIQLVACAKVPWPDEEDVPDYLKVYALTSTKIVAHRGYWNIKGSAENSIAAIDRAAETGLYATEFDVRLTADSVPVICHDPKIQNWTIETTPYAQIRNFKLPNGETLPTLSQYLTHAKKKRLRLFLEIKTTDQNDYNMRATRITVEAVDALNMREQVEYMSFSTAVCREILRLSPKASVSFLGGTIPPSEIKKARLSGLCYHYDFFRQHPEWIPEAHALGLFVGAWTVNDVQLMHDLVMQEIDYIITDKPALLQKMLNQP